MTTRFFLKPLFCFAVASLVCQKAIAQQTHSLARPLNSRQINIDIFRWQLDDSAKYVNAALVVTNKNKIDIKSVTITLAAQNKQGIMLQSGSTHTLRAKTVNQILEPKETGTYIFNRAFNNPQADSVMLKQVTVQYANGSIEILN